MICRSILKKDGVTRCNQEATLSGYCLKHYIMKKFNKPSKKVYYKTNTKKNNLYFVQVKKAIE